MRIEDYPYPNKALLIIMDLKSEGKISEEQAKVLSSAMVNYLDLRADVFYRPREM